VSMGGLKKCDDAHEECAKPEKEMPESQRKKWVADGSALW
jgi:hypothetical protein